jgi:RNA polymerase sigma factor (sigma-70 family)
MTPSIPLCVLRAQSDARLVELARDGHERAFEALVHRYRKLLLSYCRRLLLSEARAEDALQQGLLQAWLAMRDGCEVRDAKAWLYRVVHNAAISALRCSGYDYVELDESLCGATARESDIDRRIAVREALAGLAALPETQREALLRTAVQGHSREQIAADLGLTGGAVRGLVYRARATLRAAATAFTPPQVVFWAARASGSGSAHVAEIAGGTGSAGLLGLLLKGGAVVVSVGVLATGTGLVAHVRGTTLASARADSTSRPSNESHTPLGSGNLTARLSPEWAISAGATRRARNHAAGASSTKNGSGAGLGSGPGRLDGFPPVAGGRDASGSRASGESAHGSDGTSREAPSGGSGGSEDSPASSGGSGQQSSSSGSSGGGRDAGGSTTGDEAQTVATPTNALAEGAAPTEPRAGSEAESSAGGEGSTPGSGGAEELPSTSEPGQ